MSTRPLRRTPKQLEEEPVVFEAVPGKGGTAMRARPSPRTGAAPKRPGTTETGFTDDEARLLTPDEQASVDPLVRARARQIAARLSVPRPRTDSSSHRGVGDLASLPYRGGSDEIDLDASIEMLAERPVPDDEDIIVRERVRTRRSVVLAVDVSGSMKGERVQTAAATVGALAAELHRDALAVIAFWSNAAILLPLGQEVQPMDLLESMLRIPARGLTNVAFPLEIAAKQLERVPAREARVLLLSDCVHNAGPDPRPYAARLPRLDVLLDISGEKDIELGRELARLGHGSLHLMRSHRDVAPALSELFRS
ncbi:vWA domain-containing protein [Salinibacterium sp. ZJ454]|uniref:vWA domain-containing protein n=1 Tax=Salinibacterium sp. ZJ454 TaxID=2708339 RepID=UPI00142096FD|nr:vWA domain-containing protein [Salinibacterium sp. ZJ454]